MRDSTPDDLAVAFRSLARRQQEAVGDADPRVFTDLTAELQRHVDAAAAIVGSAAHGSSIAAAIEARRDWDDATIAALQRDALEAGAVLRRIAAAAAAESSHD